MEPEKTSKYYRKSALYWLTKMGNDVKKGNWEAFCLHYKNLGEAVSILRNARKNGD